MRRREFTTLLGGAVVAWPRLARTQQPAMPVIGYLSSLGQAISVRFDAAFRRGLSDVGYVEGQNLTYIFDPGSTAPDKLDAAAQSLVAANVDVIVAYGTTASLAAQRATVGTDIPVVFVGAVDPVQLGLVKSLQNTEGNVTGVGGCVDDLLEVWAFCFVLICDPRSEHYGYNTGYGLVIF